MQPPFAFAAVSRVVSVLRVTSLAFRLRDGFVIVCIAALLVVAAESRIPVGVRNHGFAVLTKCEPALEAEELEVMPGPSAVHEAPPWRTGSIAYGTNRLRRNPNHLAHAP